MNVIEVLSNLNNIFKNAGFNIYAVGGTVRDYLLQKEVYDFDFVTDATPQEMITFLDNYDNSFQKYGIINYKYQNIKIQIATFRIENKYNDFRHPSKIEFVKSMKQDYVRRDFTINAMYLDYKGKVYDFCNGIEDLTNKIIKIIGNVDQRITEDPLRILRAIRFSKKLNFKIDLELCNAIKKYAYLLEKINSLKIKEEIKKMEFDSDKEAYDYLRNFGINMFNIM